VRLGAIYALERIMIDSVRDHPTIVEVLAAFIREHTDHKRFEKKKPPERPATDVQAALTVLGRRPRGRMERPGGIDLRRTFLRGANLRHSWFDEAHFDHADLTSAQIASADFTGAFMRNADFTSAAIGNTRLTDEQRAEATGLSDGRS